MIVLAYLWLLALVPLLVEKDDPEVQWHAKHGIVLMVGNRAVDCSRSALHISERDPQYGLPRQIFYPILQLILVVHIVAIVKGVNGKRLIIPGLSEHAARLNSRLLRTSRGTRPGPRGFDIVSRKARIGSARWWSSPFSR